ncbi:hypothetical protein [Alkalilimnicola sp. S0819]|uniref:hypothetical protein n=1 Tax=Alkalilimnicola sp. S0819 TaxID=2613922 RepID=UPI001261757E|nr:hypothetical protein [Alkalilimnicola sp. S0819]KAB7627773.1 hypothetical protein F3N43_01990 [Alkalilimnicola sp. S0819]MPQ15398.1 hypothetical protein [Alkalilimnicola sp. S0819]
MKRTFLALILLTGASVAAYYGYQQWQARGPEILAEIPADTPYFFGALEPVDSSAWLSQWQPFQYQPGPEEQQRLGEALSELGAAGGLLYGLYSQYLELLQDPERFSQRLGLDPNRVGALYGVGLMPVLRQPLADAEAFTAILDEAERRGGIRHEPVRFRGEALRRYGFGPNLPKAALLVRITEDELVLTVDMPVERDALLPLALGLETPQDSLAQSGLAVHVQRQYGFEPVSVGFINHQAIVDGLVGAQDNRLGRQLSALDADGQELAALRSAGCRADLTAMAARWPLTAVGYTAFNPNAPEARMEMILAAAEAEQMNQPMRLRGHIPRALREGPDAPLFGWGLGLDMNALAPVIQTLWGDFTRQDFRCEFLVEAQQRMRAQNPAMIAMGTAMLAGIKGVSLAVQELDLDFSGPQPRPRNLRALLSLSAENPTTVLNRLQAVSPELAQVQIPSDGRAVAVPRLGQLSIPLQLAIRGEHLVLFTGEGLEPTLDALEAEAAEPNGLWWMAVDYGKLMPVMEGALKAGALDQGMSAQEAASLRAQLQQLSTLKLRLDGDLDTTERGWVFGLEFGEN